MRREPAPPAVYLLIALILGALFVGLGLVGRVGPLRGEPGLAALITSRVGDSLAVLQEITELVTWAALVVFFTAIALLRQRHRAAILLAAGYVTAEAVDYGAKLLFDRARPLDVTVDVLVATSSYPSGHLVRATVVLGLLIVLLTPPGVTRLLAIIPTVAFLLGVALARIASGEHWPTDTLGGVLLGGAWLALLLAVAPRNRARRGYQPVGWS